MYGNIGIGIWVHLATMKAMDDPLAAAFPCRMKHTEHIKQSEERISIIHRASLGLALRNRAKPLENLPKRSNTSLLKANGTPPGNQISDPLQAADR